MNGAHDSDRPLQSLPHSEDAEKGLLCSLLRAPGEVTALCKDRISSTSFYIPAHRIIYDAIFEWAKPADQVDFVWLKNSLKASNQLEEVGGAETVSSLYNFVPTHQNASDYLDIILDKQRRRDTIRLSEELRQQALEEDRDSNQLLVNAEQSLSDIRHATNGVSPLKGASLLDYSKRQISDQDTILGYRFLCRGGGMFIFAPSGIGKSVLAVQAAIEFAIGNRSFGIKPSRPLRSLLIQAEDDQGDTIEMAHGVDHLKLNEDQRTLVAKNTWMEFLNDLTGLQFIHALDRFLEHRPADLVWINPYSSYLGADIKDDKANALFLRNWLNPLLTAHQCAAVIIAHTPKTNFRDTSDWKPSDWMYAGAGAAVLTNWARAVVVVDPTEISGVYRFIAAKRGQRIGWDSGEQYFAHSREPGQLLWVPANQLEISQAQNTHPKSLEPKAILKFIPVLDPKLKETVEREIMETMQVGRDKTRAALRELQAEGKIFSRRITNPEKGRSFTGWAQTSEA